jgi:PAS domain S-box-containing protein
VLREGVVAGLANHTLLIRKDGSEGPIDDSGAPIRSAHGAITGAVLVFRDITERRRAERALMESEARFRRIADAAPVMVWMATADTTRSFFNQPWLRFTGRKLEQEVGGQWVENVHPDDRSSALDTYLSAFHARRTFRTEYRLRRSDGTYRWILDTGVPLHDADGSFAGYIGSGIDITEIKDLEADRTRILAVERDARSQAEAASRLKDEFLHTVSHELRQPLNSIIGWLHLLDQGRLDPHAAARAIATSRRSAEALKRLVEDLLDFDQLVAGRMRINLQPMDLAPVLSAALETVRPTADVKGVRLVAEVLPHVTVAGDADRLQQVFWNLLDNAVKFTSAGGAVEIHLAEMEATAVVSIRDTGEGIAPAFLPHVFERFAQQDSSTSRRHSGLGLGLAIVRDWSSATPGPSRRKARAWDWAPRSSSPCPSSGREGGGRAVGIPLALLTDREHATRRRPCEAGLTPKATRVRGAVPRRGSCRLPRSRLIGSDPHRDPARHVGMHEPGLCGASAIRTGIRRAAVPHDAARPTLSMTSAGGTT